MYESDAPIHFLTLIFCIPHLKKSINCIYELALFRIWKSKFSHQSQFFYFEFFSQSWAMCASYKKIVSV